jgi:hypothetical protein
MADVPTWERLSAATERVMATAGLSKEDAQSLICRAHGGSDARFLINQGSKLCSARSHGEATQRPGATRRSQPAFERARHAIDELFPAGVPGQADVPNAILCRRVGVKLKNKGLPNVSDDTILRAAGRRK